MDQVSSKNMMLGTSILHHLQQLLAEDTTESTIAPPENFETK